MIFYAGEIREKLNCLFISHKGKVHFRPTSSGITMVGLLSDRPQRGKGGYTANRLLKNFEMDFKSCCEDITQGRVTPEKQLQSFLISDAYLHSRKMVTLQGSRFKEDSVTRLFFVTDEIPILTEKGKQVCDILALRSEENCLVPVLIELKSSRLMQKLVSQLEEYSNAISKYIPKVEKLYTAILGRNISFSGPPEKWLIWPKEDAVLSRDRHAEELASRGIRTIPYSLDDGFKFYLG